MSILTKADIKQKLGASETGGAFDYSTGLINPLISALLYAAGDGDFDAFFEEKKADRFMCDIELNARQKGLEIKLNTGLFKSISLGVPKERIKNIKLSLEKDIRTLGAGFLKIALFGVVGTALLNGLSNLARDMLDKSKNILTIQFTDDEGRERILVFDAKPSKAQKIDDFFRTFYAARYDKDSPGGRAEKEAQQAAERAEREEKTRERLRAAASPDGAWTCKGCGQKNKNTSDFCIGCGKYR